MRLPAPPPLPTGLSRVQTPLGPPGSPFERGPQIDLLPPAAPLCSRRSQAGQGGRSAPFEPPFQCSLLREPPFDLHFSAPLDPLGPPSQCPLGPLGPPFPFRHLGPPFRRPLVSARSRASSSGGMAATEVAIRRLV